jgi:putative transposase
VLVDTLGLLLRAVAHPADIQDRDGGLDVLVGADEQFPRIEQLWAYAGDFVDGVETTFGWRVVVVSKRPEQVGFAVLPKRWIVERTLAWLCRNRRLAKDFEHLAECEEAHLYLTSISLLLKRLVPCLA